MSERTFPTTGASRSRAGGTIEAAIRAGTENVIGRATLADAVVIGAGATGGLAALLLAEAGLEVLVLDAGVPGGRARVLAASARRRIARKLLGENRWIEMQRRRQPIQSHCHVWQWAPEAFVDDLALPYEFPEDKPFIWLRSRQLGGRLRVPAHGRQYYRLGPKDLAQQDGLSPDWPVPFAELSDWYAHVERRLQMAGGLDQIPWLPDGIIERELALSSTEETIRRRIHDQWSDAAVVLSRFARPHDFLKQAAGTGRLRVRQGAVAKEIKVNRQGRVSSIEWVDHRTGRVEAISAPLVFVCASALESTRLLLLSRTGDGRLGLGAESGTLGRFLMDHVRLRLRGLGPGLPSGASEEGRCLYLPRFDARATPGPPQGRGFGVQLYHSERRKDGRSEYSIASFGEMLPRPENCVSLHPTRRDVWGIPILRIECAHGPTEKEREESQRTGLVELADALDIEPSQVDATPAPPGNANHECGTARMGTSPSDSVLDPWNECWSARGLFMTDGACLPSQGTQNPTLTYLALTARACARATGRGP